MTAVTLAVISDPHFFLKDTQKTAAYSHLPIGADGLIDPAVRGKTRNPLEDLQELISSAGLKADVLICAGDITTHANGTALIAGWKFLGELAGQLGASLLGAATGNHDVDSRSKQDLINKNVVRGAAEFKGLVEQLKLLKPTYPAVRMDLDATSPEHRESKSKYFGESFLLMEHHPDYRLMLFNSCSEHGHDPFEYERGTTPASALELVRESLAGADDQRINIMVVHHPLIPQSADGDLYSYQAGGDQLLHALEGINDDWLVINGHKHMGELKVGPSASGVGLTLFSAASFSGTSGAGNEAAENQFYLIDLERSLGGALRGRFRTWNWNLSKQWRRAPQVSKAGIYDGCGFGSGLTPVQIADLIKGSYAKGCRSWADVCDSAPQLNYVMPQAMRAATKLLQKQHKLVIDDNNGFFDALSRVP